MMMVSWYDNDQAWLYSRCYYVCGRGCTDYGGGVSMDIIGNGGLTNTTMGLSNIAASGNLAAGVGGACQ